MSGHPQPNQDDGDGQSARRLAHYTNLAEQTAHEGTIPWFPGGFLELSGYMRRLLGTPKDDWPAIPAPLSPFDLDDQITARLAAIYDPDLAWSYDVRFHEILGFVSRYRHALEHAGAVVISQADTEMKTTRGLLYALCVLPYAHRSVRCPPGGRPHRVARLVVSSAVQGSGA